VSHISSEIVNEIAKEFDIENFATEEKMMLDNIVTESNDPVLDPMLIDSTGPVTAIKIKKRKDTVRVQYIENCL